MRKFVVIAAALATTVGATLGQGTAFTYQGRLLSVTNPANGAFDLRFGLYDIATGPFNLVAPAVTNPAVAVTNGLFTVLLDFGSNAFNGDDRWLEIGVRTNGLGAFETLTPRQKITTTPYAARARYFSGPVQDFQLSANIARLDADQVFTGQIRFTNLANRYSGTFVGNGAGATNGFYPELGAPLLSRPAMGIANWIDYWNVGLGQEPGEDVTTNAILKMAANGLVASGRDWIRIDYGWVGSRVNGTLVANSTKFPHGMPWLIQFAHAHGVRVDLALAWDLDFTLDQLPGDIRTLINWGVDGICVLTDIGHWPARPTVTELREIMRIAQQANLDANAVSPIGATTNRGVPLTFSVNQEPEWRVPPETAIVANSLYVQLGFVFYGAHDIANWARTHFMPFAWFGRPGHYTHANAIRWSELQNSTNNFRIWSQIVCMMAAGFWTTTSTADNLGYLKYMTNREFNSLWSDPAGIIGHVAHSNNFNEVWVRPLGSQDSGSNLVLFLNTATNGNANLTVSAAQLGVSSNTVLRVREPLDGINLATFSGAWTYSLNQTNVALFHIFPAPESVPVIGDGRGLTNIPNGIIASGVASLSFGTNRVVTASAHPTNRFLLTYRSLNGAVATVGIKSIEANNAFTISSQNSSDTNQVDWIIVKP